MAEQNDDWKTYYEQVNIQGQSAMKSAFMINGGASVALLTVVSAIVGKGIANDILCQLCYALGCFVLGTLTNSAAFGTAYYTGYIQQPFFHNLQLPNKEYNTIHNKAKRWNNFTISLTVIGYIWFFAGAIIAFIALLPNNC